MQHTCKLFTYKTSHYSFAMSFNQQALARKLLRKILTYQEKAILISYQKPELLQHLPASG